MGSLLKIQNHNTILTHKEYVWKLANSFILICGKCDGRGQLKSLSSIFYDVPIHKYLEDMGGKLSQDIGDSIVITRCDMCSGSGLRVDSDKWNNFLADNLYPLVWDVQTKLNEILDERGL